MYELVKDRTTDFKEILVINHRHITGTRESGRAKLIEHLQL